MTITIITIFVLGFISGLAVSLLPYLKSIFHPNSDNNQQVKVDVSRETPKNIIKRKVRYLDDEHEKNIQKTRSGDM